MYFKNRKRDTGNMIKKARKYIICIDGNGNYGIIPKKKWEKYKKKYCYNKGDKYEP